MKYVTRFVGYAGWAFAFGLSVWLTLEFHQGHNPIAIGVSILALVFSAFGLIFARYSWHSRAYPEMCLGVFIWLVSCAAFTVTELNFWVSSYNARFAEYTQQKKESTQREALRDHAWQTITTGAVAPAPSQIEAQLKARQFDPLYSRSKQCTDATLPDSRAFCSAYYQLQAALAEAKERRRLEGAVSKNLAEKDDGFVHNVFANADILASALALEPKQAAIMIILLTWLLLMIIRDTALLIADPTGTPPPRKRKQKVDSVAVEATPTVAQTPIGAMFESRYNPASSYSIGWREDKPPNGGNVISLEEAREKPSERPQSAHGRTGRAVDWMNDTTTQEAEARLLSGVAYANYKSWCEANDLVPIGQRPFTKKIKATLHLGTKRDAATGQQIFPLVLTHPAQWQGTKAAAG